MADTSTPAQDKTDVGVDAFASAFEDAKQPGEPPPEVKRDRWGRYLLPDPESGKIQAWTRVTTFAKTVADMYNIDLYHQRLVVKGMSMRPDLFAEAASVHVEDKSKLNEIANYAREAAGESGKARLGTALHTFTEKADLGEKQVVPPPWDEDVKAYTQCLKDNGISVIPEFVEATVIIPKFNVAGTIDRLATIKGRNLPVVDDLKGLSLDTPIPTPTGWTTMGAVQTGDAVLGSDGRLCRVTAKSNVQWKDCYRITFDDGTSVVCDSDHRWLTRTDLDEAVRTTDEIRQTLFSPNKRPQRWHRIANTRPLDLPERDLPIDPYILGCWLGDGAVRGGTITKTRDLFEVIESDGHILGVEQVDSRRPDVITRTVRGLRTALIANGIQYNKHVPDAYLRASYDQRLRLLQGLMDTDGTWNRPRSQAVFNSTDKRLAEGVHELALSLGWRATMFEHEASGFGKTVTAYSVPFTPFDANPFRLPRKAELVDVKGKDTRARRRLIRSVEPTPSVPTQCIMVDSPDHTYLCGDQMVPTHNTGKSVQYAWMEIACQLYLYSQATHIYDHATGEIREMPPVDQSRGIVVHLPVGQATATLYDIDLELGARVAAASEVVRELRKRKNFATEWTGASTDDQSTGGTLPTLPAASDDWDEPTKPPPAPPVSEAERLARSKAAAAKGRAPSNKKVAEQNKQRATAVTGDIEANAASGGFERWEEAGVDLEGTRYQHVKVDRQKYLLVDIERGTSEEFKLLRDAKTRKKELEADGTVRPLGATAQEWQDQDAAAEKADDDWGDTDESAGSTHDNEVARLKAEVTKLRSSEEAEPAAAASAGDDFDDESSVTSDPAKRQWFAEIGSANNREELLQIHKDVKAAGITWTERMTLMAKTRQAELDVQAAAAADDDDDW